MADGGRPKPRFGEEDRELSYGSYLRIPELLSLQTLLSDPPAHDELLFIVVHQAYELWFNVILFELGTVREAMFAGHAHRARHALGRVLAIQRVLLEHLAVIETMSPQDFLEFRSNLAPASGFQSVQFREIEIVSGLKEPGLVAKLGDLPEERERLSRRLGEPTLWDAFCALLEAYGLPMPAGEDRAGERRESLLSMMRDGDTYADAVGVSEDLLAYDEGLSMWRYRHILMVERQIGSKTGTGGSTGSSYLRTTLDKRLYPELWDVRSYL